MRLKVQVLSALIQNNIENIDFNLISLKEDEKLSILKYALALKNIKYVEILKKHISFEKEVIQDIIFYCVEEKNHEGLDCFEKQMERLIKDNRFIMLYLQKATEFQNRHAIEKMMQKIEFNINDYPQLFFKYEERKNIIDFLLNYQKSIIEQNTKNIILLNKPILIKKELEEKIKIINQKAVLESNLTIKKEFKEMKKI